MKLEKLELVAAQGASTVWAMPETPTVVRAFVAATPPASLEAVISRIQRALGNDPAMKEIRWVRPAQIHLTLKFFGNVQLEQVADLQGALKRAAGSVPRISVSVGGYGCFPSEQRPSVIWLGLRGDLAGLRHLHERIDHETEAFGSHSETRAFHPHLTIGRIRAPSGRTRQTGAVLRAQGENELGSWTIEKVLLMRSVLAASGSTYSTVAALRLGGSSQG